MLVAVLTIGGAASVIVIAALLAKSRASAAAPTAPIVRPIPAEDPKDQAAKIVDDNSEAIGGAAKIVGEVGKKVLDVIGPWYEPSDPEPTPPEPPAPGPPAGPDPYHPSPVPRPGDYYQVVPGDTLWEMSRAAYGSGADYPKIVAAAENKWIGKDGAPWKGGLYPKYSGWNTLFGSGTKHPVVYIP